MWQKKQIDKVTKLGMLYEVPFSNQISLTANNQLEAFQIFYEI